VRRLLLLWHLHIDEVVADQAILTLTLADHQPVPAGWLLLALALALDERIQKDLANVL